MSTRLVDPESVASLIREVAADKIEPRFQQLKEGDIREKTGPSDLVTIADIEAEEVLTKLFGDLLPGSLVVGEEAVSHGTVALETLKTQDDPVWVVDPVDGTHNFATGTPIFGTMVSLVDRGETVMSWIYQIPQRRMTIAQKGSGVCIAGTRVRQSDLPPTGALKDMRAFISRRFIPPPLRPVIDSKIAMLAKASTYFCCAHEYVSMLEGEAAFSIYKRIKPWDHLAGVLMLEEAGFHVRKWDGSPYVPSDTDGGLLNARTESL